MTTKNIYANLTSKHYQVQSMTLLGMLTQNELFSLVKGVKLMPLAYVLKSFNGIPVLLVVN